MNKFLVLALSLLIGGLGSYANTVQDTIIVVNQAKKVTIEKKHNSMAVKVEGSAENPDYFYSQRMEVDSTAAVIIEEKDLTEELLTKTVENLLADSDTIRNMEKAAIKCSVPDSNERIYKIIKDLYAQN